MLNRNLLGWAVAGAMTVALAAPISVSAQTPPAPQPQAEKPGQERPAPMRQESAQKITSPLQGDLVSVDADAKRITVKPTTGDAVTFTYTDKTEISGAEKDAAGLATTKDARVTVHFTEDATTKARTATRIIVEPKK